MKNLDRVNKWVVTFFIGLLWIGFLPISSDGYVIRDDEHGTALSIFGLGMVRLNYASITGNTAAFEESDDGFAEQFDTQGLLSLTVDGILYHNYALEGEVRYNEDDDPFWNFRFKLSRDDHYLIFGDQPDIFSEVYFTRYTSPFRGLTLHLGTETFSVTTFGALTRGSSEKQEITPNGTSGPYTLDAIPIVPGSEIVTLEVRNQNDPRQLIELIPQARNVDYSIDYDTGDITFTHPVDVETFRGDPIVIVVIYRTEVETSQFDIALAGARAAVNPTKWLNVGVTYVSEFSREPSLSDGFDMRQEVYGIDTTLTFGEALKLTTEYAMSHNLTESETNQDLPYAFQAKLDGKFGEKFDLYGEYQRAERDFLTFANPDIETDEQTLDVGAKYYYRSNQYLEAGYSFLQDNLPHDADNPTTTTHRPFVGWDAMIREHTELFAKYEFIQTADDQTPKETDKQTHTLLVGGIQEFLDVPLFNKLIMQGEYQRSDFEDGTDLETDTITQQAALRLQTEPVKDMNAYVEQRERWIYEKDRNKNTERQDISEIGAQLKQWERFSLEPKYQYRRTADLLLDELTSEKHTLIIISKFLPFSTLTASGKVEFRDETMHTYETADAESTQIVGEDQNSSQGLTLEGRLMFTPIEDLSAQLSYTYEQSKDEAETTTKTWEDEGEFRINYAFDQRKTRLTGSVKLERDFLEAEATPETETRIMTYLASITRQITDHWDILAQYKQERTEVAADNVREDVLAEIGYEAGRFLKFVSGYQYSRFQDDDDQSNDYEVNSFYVKLIGKL